MTGLDLPDGIGPSHLRPSRMRGPLNACVLLLLAGFIAAALAGLFGGGAYRRVEEAGDGARLSVESPAIHRNGKLYEIRIVVEATRDIADAVIAVDESLWRDVTVNTLAPAPAEESFSDGAFRYSYGPLTAGETLLVKTDLQLNANVSGRLGGRVAAYDGERLLSALDIVMKARP